MNLELYRFCDQYDIKPKSIQLPHPSRKCSKIVIWTHAHEQIILYPAIRRWTHVKSHHMQPLVKSIMKSTGPQECGEVEINDVSIIISRFLTLQNIYTEPGDLKRVYKNNEHCIRCIMRPQHHVEQAIIDNTHLRVYNIMDADQFTSCWL